MAVSLSHFGTVGFAGEERGSAGVRMGIDERPQGLYIEWAQFRSRHYLWHLSRFLSAVQNNS